jgi:putative membrane protein
MMTNPDIPFSRNWPLHLMIFVFAVYWGFMAISPSDRMQWLMESLLPVSVVLVLAFTYKVFRFSNFSYLLMFVFLCLHTYAAHYTYQGTPFDMWLKASYHTQRSYFDRVVHFVFGLFWAYPVRELLTRAASQRGFWSYAIPAAVVFSCVAFFEIIEMGAALVAGQIGEEYVGLQGDVFDTQKDMGLGLAGAVISMGMLAWILWRKEVKKIKPADFR